MDVLDGRTEREVEAKWGRFLAPLIGQQVAEIAVGSVQHSFDSSYSADKITIGFADGSTLALRAQWCNDSTADLAPELRES